MNRINELRKEKHITQTALAMKLHVTQNMVSFYETGKYEPGISTLIEMSNIFNVSVDYLVGNSDIKQKADDIIKNGSSPAEAEMIQLFRTLTKDEQQRAIGIIQAVKYLKTE